MTTPLRLPVSWKGFEQLRQRTIRLLRPIQDCLHNVRREQRQTQHAGQIGHSNPLALCQFADGEGVLEHGRKGLRARGVIGVIAIPGCQLEILPQIEGGGESGVSDAVLRQRLIHMLAVTYDLPIDAGAMTLLGWQRETVLDLLIRLFCAKLPPDQNLPEGRPSREPVKMPDRDRADAGRRRIADALAPIQMTAVNQHRADGPDHGTQPQV